MPYTNKPAKEQMPTTGESTTEEHKPGFFSRHMRKILYGGVIAIGYVLISAISLQYQTAQAAKYEEYNPRRKVEEKYMVSKSVDKVVDITGGVLADAAIYPWKKMGLVTHDQYLEVSKKAFEIAGIDENNPGDDAKRFAFYRHLGFAVRKTDNHMQSVYIPFKNLKNFIEETSEFRLKGWDKYEEWFSKDTWPVYSAALGKAFFKADSKSEGGNEDGVADNIEWGKALNQMGYRTMENVVSELLERFTNENKADLKSELEKLITEVRENPDYLIGDVPEKIPTEKLETYISSK